MTASPTLKFFAGTVVAAALGFVVGWWLGGPRPFLADAPPHSNEIGPKPPPITKVQRRHPAVAMPSGFESIPLRKLRDQRSLVQQIRAALAMAQNCPAADIPGKLSEIDRMRGREGVALQILEYALAARWVDVDPAGATATAMTDGPSVRPSVFLCLAGTHPRKLLDRWPEVQRRLAEQPELGRAVVVSLLQSSPESAVELLRGMQQEPGALPSAEVAVRWHLDPEDAKQKAIESGRVNELLTLWKSQDLDAACHWALQHDPKNLNRLTLGAWVQSNPAGVMNYLQTVASPEARDALLQPISQQIGRIDPKAGLDWLANQPASSGKVGAMANSLVDWLAADSEAASAWLRAHPPTEERDSLVRAFSQVAQGLDPPRAFEWAATIIDPAIRSQSLDRMYENWQREDPEGAQSWLESSPNVPADLLKKQQARLPE